MSIAKKDTQSAEKGGERGGNRAPKKRKKPPLRVKNQKGDTVPKVGQDGHPV